MVELNIYKNQNTESKGYGMYYPRVDYKEQYDVAKLAKHMAEHNTPFSKGTIQGILTDMVSCIRELTLDGNTVKIENLAIFKATVQGNGVPSLDKARAAIGGSVKSMRLCAQATGAYTKAELNKDATLGWTKAAHDQIDAAKEEPEP